MTETYDATEKLEDRRASLQEPFVISKKMFYLCIGFSKDIGFNTPLCFYIEGFFILHSFNKINLEYKVLHCIFVLSITIKNNNNGKCKHN